MLHSGTGPVIVQAPIYFDDRWCGNHGIGRFATEIRNRLPGIVPLQIMGRKLSLFDPLATSVALARKCSGFYLSPGFNPPLRSPIPFAFTIHDLIHLRVPEESSAMRRLYYATVVRPATRKAARILTVSEYSRQDILDWSGVAPEAVRVVGNGVSSDFNGGPPLSGRQPYLLHVGRRVGHKNVNNLLRGFASSRARADVQLVFTGNADPQTLSLARAAGLAQRVRFSGPVDDVVLATLYQGGLALVYPSLHEGFGLPVIEAMACGMPVITSSTTSLPDVAGEGNALLVDPREPSEIAEAIDRVLEDSLLWDKLSGRGRDRAREFTWERVCARVSAALDAE